VHARYLTDETTQIQLSEEYRANVRALRRLVTQLILAVLDDCAPQLSAEDLEFLERN
jgi:hypothetical protein